MRQTHRWIGIPRRWRRHYINIKHVYRSHWDMAFCIKCGAMRYSIGGQFRYPLHFIQLWSDRYRQYPPMPPCRGLPADYSAPIGA